MKRTKKKNKPTKEQGKVLFFFFFGYLILFVPVYHLTIALDQTLMPRLLMLSFLFMIMPYFILGKKYRNTWNFSLWRHSVFKALLGLLVVTMVSAAFAYNYIESLFDILKLILLISGVGIIPLLLENRPDWQERLSKLFIIAASISCFIGFVQYYQFVVLSESKVLEDGRHVVYTVIGLFSHKNLFSVFLMLLLPFTAYGIYKLRNLWRAGAIISSILIVILVALLKTRSVWVGGSISFFLSAVLLVANSHYFSIGKLWKRVILIGMVSFFAGIFLILRFGDNEDAFSIKGRIESIADVRSVHNIHRLNIWSSTVELIKDYPILGVGPGNWKLIAPKYFSEKFNHIDELTWVRPHNDYLWVLAELGIIGLLLFISVFVIIFYYLLKIILSRNLSVTIENRIIALFLFAGLVVYSVDASFSFPYERTDIQMILMMYFGISVFIYNKLYPAKKPIITHPVFLYFALLVFSFSAFYAYRVIRMESNLKYAMNYMAANNNEPMLHYASEATTIWKSNGPVINPPEHLIGLAYLNLGNNSKALDAFKKAENYTPNSARLLSSIAQTYYNMGQMEESKVYLNKVIDIFPSHREVILGLTRIYMLEGAYSEAYNTIIKYPNWQNDPEILNIANSLEEELSN